MNLLKRYNAHIALMKASRVPLAHYLCPDCNQAIECLIPQHGQVYDSLVTCPHCEQTHFKAVHSDGAVDIVQPITKHRASSGGES